MEGGERYGGTQRHGLVVCTISLYQIVFGELMASTCGRHFFSVLGVAGKSKVVPTRMSNVEKTDVRREWKK